MPAEWCVVHAYEFLIVTMFPSLEPAAVGKWAFWGQRWAIEGPAVAFYRFPQLAAALGQCLSVRFSHTLVLIRHKTFSENSFKCLKYFSSCVENPPDTSVRMSILTECKTCGRRAESPFLKLSKSLHDQGIVQHSNLIITLLSRVRSGLGTTTSCFRWHPSLQEYAGVEEKAAGEGRQTEGGSTDGLHHFISRHQEHSAGPERLDDPRRQSGASPPESSYRTSHTQFFPPFSPRKEEVTAVWLKLLCFLL